MEAITSPAFIPAWSAGESGITAPTNGATPSCLTATAITKKTIIGRIMLLAGPAKAISIRFQGAASRKPRPLSASASGSAGLSPAILT